MDESEWDPSAIDAMVDAYNEEHSHQQPGGLVDLDDDSSSLRDDVSVPSYGNEPVYTDSDGSSPGDQTPTPGQNRVIVPQTKLTDFPSNKPVKCLYCRKFGQKETFRGKTKKYCSIKCQKAAKASKENIKKKTGKRKPDEKPGQLVAPSVAKSEKLPVFKWSQYLHKNGADAASVTCFKHVPMADCWENISVGIKVEVANVDCEVTQDVYWIATVVKIAGYNAKLRYEGFGSDSSRDFWMNLCSEALHPVGWCAAFTKPLVPPQSIMHKHADWKEFLVKRLTGARTLPINFHDKVHEAVQCTQLRPRMRVEVVDKMWVSAMRVAQVMEVHGGRCRLQYEASSYDDNDFWIHEQSPLVHFVGWSESVKHKIHASAEYRQRSLKKLLHNDYHDLDATPDHFDQPAPPPPGVRFEKGMKLEAVDPLNLSAICPATVMKVLEKGYIMIGIDGQMAENGSDWFALHASSPTVFPVGWCDQNNIALTPPKDYAGKFSWTDYLLKTRTRAAPDMLFQKPVPKHGLSVGMKLEAVDLMEPRLLCVASVARVVGRLIRVHFDGWDSSYDQWLDCESADIYPVGWCEMVGYSLEGPPNEYSADVPPPVKKPKKNVPFTGRSKKKRKSAVVKTESPLPKKMDQSESSATPTRPVVSQSETPTHPVSQSEAKDVPETAGQTTCNEPMEVQD